ncbi:RALGAPA1 [Branchiostoma lanceolatum]|uniref:RALGAPA1 protein n=1 Tax=Branchiostoma lanceolatum TaxID=7740 RepID=A0A8K0EQM3_BRALA|nr:RALGAPA1 [Branchiostoma lanceolatum]
MMCNFGNFCSVHFTRDPGSPPAAVRIPASGRTEPWECSEPIPEGTLTHCSSYEERAKYVETIVQQHKDLTTFEEFSASVYAPAMGKGAEASSGGSQRDANQSDAGQGGAEGEGGVTLRHQQGSPKLRHRMSMKIRRSSGPKLPHSSSSSTTPPESPNVRGKKT